MTTCAKSFEDKYKEIYDAYRLDFYKNAFKAHDENKELSALEMITMEIVLILDGPTVNELANFLNTSQPNAAYKVGSLVKKGFLDRVQSEDDKREFFLYPTKKYKRVHAERRDFPNRVRNFLLSGLGPEELKHTNDLLDYLMNAVDEELKLE